MAARRLRCLICCVHRFSIRRRRHPPASAISRRGARRAANGKCCAPERAPPGDVADTPRGSSHSLSPASRKSNPARSLGSSAGRHAHRLIAKIARSRRCCVSLGGRRLMASAMNLREVAFPKALHSGRRTEELVCRKRRSDEGRIYGHGPPSDPKSLLVRLLRHFATALF
jgi:hypothetical protein